MRRLGLIIFIFLGLVWGTSFAFMKVALHSYSPVEIGALRVTLGAAVVWLVALRLHRESLGRALKGPIPFYLIVSGVVFTGLPYALIAWGETRTTSSAAGMFNATIPIFTTLFSPLFLKDEIVGRHRRVGIAVGVIGMLILFGPGQLISGGRSGVGDLGVIAASSLFGVGYLFQKRYLLFSEVPYVVVSAVQLTCAGVFLFALAFVSSGHFIFAPRVWTDLFWLVVLGVFNTGIATTLSLRLTQLVHASVSSSVTYVAALVSVGLGTVVLRERLGPSFVVGSVVTMLGLVVLTFGDRVSLQRLDSVMRR